MKYIKWQSLPLCKKNVDDYPKNYNEHLKDNKISKHVFMHSAKPDQNAEIATLIMLSINQKIIVMFIAKCLTKNKKESQTKV